MSEPITSLPVASTIDGVADTFPIVTSNINTTQQINRNTFLGLASAPVGLTDSQSITNKTISTTNSITQLDGTFALENTSDNTKIAKFSLASITTGTTRTYTLPDATDTIVTLGATQTLTSKTLTSPTINTPTITNATISADTLSGFTTSNSGTIYGIGITTGQFSGNAIIIPNNLFASTGTTWSYSTFTPSPTGFSGSPTVAVARYIQIGKTVIMDISFTGTSNATTLTFTLPVAAKTAANYYASLVEDNGSFTSPGRISLTGGGSTTATCYKTVSEGAWTASGAKFIEQFGIVYEAN